MFGINELKTMEIDVEKKIFNINGEPFGKGCTSFSIFCRPKEFEIWAELEGTVRFVTFNLPTGKKISEGSCESK